MFNTEMNYNPEKVSAAISIIDGTDYYISAAKIGISSEIDAIKGALGYDLVKKEGGDIDNDFIETIIERGKRSIKNIKSTIQEKIELIEAYSNAEGMEKTGIFSQTALSNIEDIFEKSAQDFGDTAADILHGFSSFTGGLLPNFSTGKTKTSDISNSTETFNSTDKGKEETGTKIESKNTITQTANNIFASYLKNENTSNKSIDTTRVKEGTRVGDSIKKYADEVAGAEYATINENIFTTTRNETIAGEPVKVTHVVINNPDQINGAPANGSYANGKELGSSAAKRLNSTILINGSHYTADGSEDLLGDNHIVIVNKDIKHDGVSGGHELLLDDAGNIFNTAGVSAQELVDRGVKYSFSCHSTQVIVNGDTSPSHDEPAHYKRTVIGQSEPGEFYIVTDTTTNNYLWNTADYLKEKGCENAYSLDQGSSVTLVRNDTVINNPSSDETPTGERYVGDFLYFTS